MSVEVAAFGRIHAGLIDLSDTGYRLNGGVGWAVDGFEARVRASASNAWSISDERAEPMAHGELQSLCDMLAAFGDSHGHRGTAIVLSGDLPSHRGLGAGTALRLAMLEACSLLWGVRVTRGDLVVASGRGGTSGVGVRTYFEGGLVVDLGHPRGAPAAPSRDRATAGPALELLRFDMPEWDFGITVLPNVPPADIAIERRIFETALPLHPHDVRSALYEIIYGVVAGALDCDEATFAQAIDHLQQGAWKHAEWSSHGSIVKERADQLRFAGARGIGLSSMGPTLFWLAGHMKRLSAGEDVQWVKPRNRGREVRRSPRA
jgi:beta-ribofuranosylaminobenzene 5'-phosphate synthase